MELAYKRKNFMIKNNIPYIYTLVTDFKEMQPIFICFNTTSGIISIQKI